MSWWLFLPLAWIAMSLNLIVARDLSWGTHAPDFLILLLSFVVVRPSRTRRIWQALCLGLLMDFSGAGKTGVCAISAVLTVAMLSRWTRSESDDSAAWLFWAFPTMALCLGLATLGMRFWGNVSAIPVHWGLSIFSVSTVTMIWGIVICTLVAVVKRLAVGKDRTYSREPNSLSFFLAR